MWTFIFNYCGQALVGDDILKCDASWDCYTEKRQLSRFKDTSTRCLLSIVSWGCYKAEIVTHSQRETKATTMEEVWPRERKIVPLYGWSRNAKYDTLAPTNQHSTQITAKMTLNAYIYFCSMKRMEIHSGCLLLFFNIFQIWIGFCFAFSSLRTNHILAIKNKLKFRRIVKLLAIYCEQQKCVL